MSDKEDIGQLAVRRAGMEHKGDFKPAANMLTQLARGWAAGTAGLPGDLEGLARLVNKYTTLNPAVRALDTTPVLPTTDFYKEWLPGEDNGVGGKELNNIGSLFGGVGAGTAASGAVDLGKGALTLASKAARNAAVPRTLSSQAGVIKAPGGNWLSGSVEDALKGLKATREPLDMAQTKWEELTPQSQALNSWVDKQLTRYVKNDMATERDPVRALAEKGPIHKDFGFDARAGLAPRSERVEAGFPAEGLGKSEQAIGWERATDREIANNPARLFLHTRNGGTGIPTVERNPWLTKLDPDATVHDLQSWTNPGSFGFDHLLDELRNATNPASGLPRELQLDIKSLDRLSVPQAVERVARINDWRAAQKVEASQTIANNPAAHLLKEYPHTPETPNPKGLRWVELKQPKELTEEQLAPFAADVRIKKSLGDVPGERAKRLSLEDQLKYEGDTMGHCVGGYCDGVASGKSRILSLRDAKGQPHVTVEISPGKMPRLDGDFEELPDAALAAAKAAMSRADFTDGRMVRTWIRENWNEPIVAAPASIVQIKGKANQAPNAEYLPFVQDLVRGGLGGDLTNWERVGDLSNAGLKRLSDMGSEPMIQRAREKLGEYATHDEWDQIMSGKAGFATGGSVPNNPYTIDAAAFHSAVDPLLGDAGSWQAHDDSPQKLALQLGNGATWNVGGGEGTYGSGVYRYDPITEADDKRYQEALAAYNATGLATLNPDNIAVGSGSKADRDNMLESWLGSGGALGALRAGAQGFDTGESGRVEGHTPTAEEWAAALAKDAPGYDPNKPIYRVRGDMSQLLGKPDSRMFLDAGYQEVDGRMVPLGTPSRTYQKSVGAENISMLSALLAPYAVGTALTNAAAGGGSAMAQAATEANAANAAQGFGQLGVAGAAPAAGLGEQAIAAYQAAQPYLKAANTVGALARGNPMGALGGYLPGMDLGLGDFGNTVANGAVKAGLSGGNPLLGAVAGAAGEVIPAELRQYLPMAQSLVAATEGKLSLTQALNMLARYNSSSSKGT